ncbi:hypothetical protein ASPFODRAFT_43479 [Aspergillus luchuensis CBS 106.47]|uniref:Uncharacterized protein n=1 Tax=Aspergillus luchuensis (strain CBS 106.47) TaxID=1137211 RepID=A0A1M3TT90_ASPLC|nr:hypothetical protein ASPFODRAFT_43479 [Aspergillus luchuensis CBS 106.47]
MVGLMEASIKRKWRQAAQKESSALGQGRRRHGGKIDECTGLVPAPVRLDWAN